MLARATPEYVLVALFSLYLYSKIAKKCGERIRIVTHCHWFVCMYMYLCYLLAMALRCMLMDIVGFSNCLDPEIVDLHVRTVMKKENDSHSFEEWRKDASLVDYPLLRWWTLTSPIWVIATFLVCLYHISKHAGRMNSLERSTGTRGLRWIVHDRTIIILLLPMVYGLMSLHGVIYALGVVCNVREHKHFDNWKTRREYFEEMYDCAFYVGDIYESYALLVLGGVILEVLGTKIRRDLEVEVKDEEASITSSEVEQSEQTAQHRRAAQILISTEDLMNEIKDLTTFGIKFFCWTCGLQALYQLVRVAAGYYRIWEPIFGLGGRTGVAPGLVHTPGVQSKCDYFFLGAGFVSSFAAIGNIMKVETAFHRQLHEFGPYWKFWGTKVLVSIAFVQSMAVYIIPPQSHWSDIRRKLFYGSVLCLECFLVSLLHLHAWAHDQSWYLSIGCGSPHGENSSCDSVTDDPDCAAEIDPVLDRSVPDSSRALVQAAAAL